MILVLEDILVCSKDYDADIDDQHTVNGVIQKLDVATVNKKTGNDINI